MLVAIISDIHDNLDNLTRAMARINAHRDGGGEPIGALLFCGDLCAPFMVRVLAQQFAGPITLIWGNVEGDKFRITTFAAGVGNGDDGEPRFRIAGETAQLELDGKRICLHHFNDVGALLATTDAFDLVCYGHDHAYVLRRGPRGAIEMNPGAILGFRPGVGAVPVTYGLYDTTTGAAAIYDVNHDEPLLTLES